jgi:hypothetical protein
LIQHSATSLIEANRRGILDTPQEPVIGLAEGRDPVAGMTVSLVSLFDIRIKNRAAPDCIKNILVSGFERHLDPPE